MSWAALAQRGELQMELIEKLKHHIKYHIRPYNLGDKGETETLILELIRKYEAAQQSVHPTCGDSAPLQALPTPEADTIAGHLSTPPTSG